MKTKKKKKKKKKKDWGVENTNQSISFNQNLIGQLNFDMSVTCFDFSRG